MKKLTALLLALILAVSLAACNLKPVEGTPITPGDITTDGNGGGNGGSGGGGGGSVTPPVTDAEKQEYEDSLASWSQSGHLYFHYMRYNNTKAEYDLYDLWLWQNKPVDSEGKSFDYAKTDKSGAVFDIDLNKTYTDGGKTGTASVNYSGTTRMGFLVVLKSSKGGAGHWTSDGGNIYIDDFDTLARDDGSIHIFISEGATIDYKTSYLDTIERKDPYEDITPGSATTKNNVDSSRTTYGYTATAPDFQKTAGVGYQIQVCSFADSDGDGMGDIKGITENLDYLDDTLHVNVLWLTPVQLSESYHGYDITDFYRIDPKFGTLDDYRELMYEAHKRGMKVLMDLVVNHTAKNNVWFDKSTNLVKEKATVGGVEQEIDYRNFYNWRTAAQLPSDAQYKQSWYSYGTGDKEYYYFARFNNLMPELNYDYQGTRDAIVDVALYWLAFGLDGFRIDAVKHVYMEGEYSSAKTNNDKIDYEDNGYSRNVTKNVAFFKEFNARVKAAYPDAFIVGENFDGSGERLAPYFEGIDSQFNFNAYYNLGRDAVGKGSSVGLGEYLANYNRFKAYRSDFIDSAFTSNHDVNRALNIAAGDLHTDQINRAEAEKKLRAWSSVVLTLPGLSWIYYGDELGMEGDKGDASVPHGDRWIRQPFKWTTAAKAEGGSAFTAGFKFDQYTIEWNDYNKQTAGVAEQKADAGSMLNHFASLTQLKSTDPVLICGSFEQISVTNGIFSFKRSYNGVTYRVYHNLTGNNYDNVGGTPVWSSNGATPQRVPAYSSIIVK